MKYLVFNKESDYRRGYYENLIVQNGHVLLEDCDAKRAGRFFSRTLDSGEEETIWHRMKLDAWIGENMAIYVYLYATDSKIQVKQVEEFWREEGELRQAASVFSHLCRLEIRNPQDILLHQVQGRFLWLGMSLWGNGTESPRIRSIQIFFPKEVWNQYLPELYQGKDQEFLERFLGIFQSLYQDMETRIRTDTSYLDLQAADEEMLLWLADWIHVENGHLWSTGHLREYLKDGAALFEQRGTARGLLRMVELFTGEKPYLIERTAGDNPHRCMLLVKEEAIADIHRYRAAERIIREGTPAGMEVKLVPLRPYLFLDQHTYLGINSRLGVYRPAVIGSEGTFDFTVLGGGQDEESDILSI